ncbi:right-handed parallel beta-helix repeat-containing protein [Aliiroseovarius sp. YM-037]|uniref:right-handed parallel beta-helix repeat-containing protein n=1 Tax=Aliiroseovarius sp. YM-037 TaxID=3341728 RepID=UPI003A8060FC
MPSLFRKGCLDAQRLILAALFGAHMSGASSAAEPAWELLELRANLTQLSDDLRPRGGSREPRVRDLVEGLSWSLPNAVPSNNPELRDPATPAVFGWTDGRMALATLSQVYGGADNFDVLQATRKGDNEAILIESGVATLDQLRRNLTNRHIGWDVRTRTDVLRVPIIVGQDATLQLGRDEVLMLSRRDGAFIMNYGRLEVMGGEISATTDQNERNDEFNPFIASLGSGSVHLSEATFTGLGFGNTEKFGGFSILAYPTLRPSQRSVIEYSSFEGLVTLSVVGVTNVELRENKLFDMRRIPLLISRSQNALVVGNLFAGDSPTNAIRVSDGSDRTKIIGNIILEGRRAGLLIASGSDHVEVSGNLIWHRNGGGVKLHNVACGRVEQNTIVDDKQKGVEIRNSRDSFIHANHIIGNKNAGIWVSDQIASDVTYVSDNMMRENGSGVATATGANIAMSGNDLSMQLPRLLDGDVTQHFRSIVRDLHGQTPIILNAGGALETEQLSPESCES